MSFSRRKSIPKVIDFTCDGCSSEFLETTAYELRGAMGELAEAGWHHVTIGDEHEHFCPGCSKRMKIT